MSENITIRVLINSKTYPISCKLGEEERVRRSAAIVNDTLKNLKEVNDTFSDNKLLVMTSLILADKTFSDNVNPQSEKEILDQKEMIKWIEKMSARLNNVATLINDS